MANRSRSTAKSGVVQKPGETSDGDAPAVVAVPAAAPAAATAAPAQPAADDTKPISLSHEDFEGNPAVVNMADVVDGPQTDGDAADLDPNRVRNEANDANARRIIEQDRAKPASSPFSNADLADDEDDVEDDEDELRGAPINQPGPAVESLPKDEPDGAIANEAAGRKEARKGSVLVTLGDRTKNGGRAPYAVTVIVPRAGEDTDEAHDAVITDGTTIQLARGRATRVAARAADWLAKHKLYSITEVKVQKG